MLITAFLSTLMTRISNLKPNGSVSLSCRAVASAPAGFCVSRFVENEAQAFLGGLLAEGTGGKTSSEAGPTSILESCCNR